MTGEWGLGCIGLDIRLITNQNLLPTMLERAGTTVAVGLRHDPARSFAV